MREFLPSKRNVEQSPDAEPAAPERLSPEQVELQAIHEIAQGVAERLQADEVAPDTSLTLTKPEKRFGGYKDIPFEQIEGWRIKKDAISIPPEEAGDSMPIADLILSTTGEIITIQRERGPRRPEQTVGFSPDLQTNNRHFERIGADSEEYPLSMKNFDVLVALADYVEDVSDRRWW